MCWCAAQPGKFHVPLPVQRLEAHPRITIHYNTQMTALHGEDQLEGITIHSRIEEQTWKLNTSSVFVMVGAAPNTALALGSRGARRQGVRADGAGGWRGLGLWHVASGDFRRGRRSCGIRQTGGERRGRRICRDQRVWDFLNG
jgi:thioredoxin reductase (NADPH)